MSALDRRGDVIRALSATREWRGIELAGGRFNHHAKASHVVVDFSARGGAELWSAAEDWTVQFAPSVPDAVVLAACKAAAAEAGQ